jgi:ACR3 family arsenite transporter
MFILRAFGQRFLSRLVMMAIVARAVAQSVILFVGLPLILGQASRKLIIEEKGEKWFRDTFRPILGNVAAASLLATIVILFSLKGDVIVNQPFLARATTGTQLQSRSSAQEPSLKLQ